MRALVVLTLLLTGSAALAAEELPLVPAVEHQPLAAQVTRLLDALDMLGDPLPAADTTELRRLAGGAAPAEAVQQIQKILDRHCLVGVNINPESRVKVQQGPARAELVEQGWRTFLVKVHNEAGVTAVLAVSSPNAGQLANSPEGQVRRRFLDLQQFTKQPLRPHLSGLELEYRILQIYSRDPGKREGKLAFDVGQGSQDLGFRNEVDILFTALAAAASAFVVRPALPGQKAEGHAEKKQCFRTYGKARTFHGLPTSPPRVGGTPTRWNDASSFYEEIWEARASVPCDEEGEVVFLFRHPGAHFSEQAVTDGLDRFFREARDGGGDAV